MFGSERLLREYRTSEEMSHFNNTHGSKGINLDILNMYNIRPEIDHDQLLFHNYELEEGDEIEDRHIHANYLYNFDNHSNEDNKTEDFMATNELIDLFQSENNKKTYENTEFSPFSKLNTQTLFEKNPFKDFSMAKISEVLNNKDVSGMQEMIKNAIDYRHNVISKVKDSSEKLATRKIDVEKWVEKEINSLDQSQSLENLRQKTINTICNTNLITERAHTLLANLNQSQSSLSIQNDKPLQKTTIDDLLLTSSDKSPLDIFSHASLKSNNTFFPFLINFFSLRHLLIHLRNDQTKYRIRPLSNL
jgi:hypothetical protein